MTGTVRMDLRQWVSWTRRLAQDSPRIIARGLRSTAMRALPILHRATEQAPPASPNGAVGAVDTGGYKLRWRAAPGPNSVVITNDAPHAGVIEDGRRVGARPPPSDVIARWAQRRLGLPYAEARRLAFSMAREIGRRGLTGRQVYASAEPQIEQALVDEVTAEFREAVGE